ncbi:MAG: hypothetical protein F6K41_24015 [Symploca sp. SIO3E6]|nr:hypothetical protein [Caldora sp. SIO3E6]
MTKQDITATDVVAVTSLAVATGVAAYVAASKVKTEAEPRPVSTPVRTILTTTSNVHSIPAHEED